MFVVEEEPPTLARLGHLQVEPLARSRTTAKTDLSLYFRRIDRGWRVTMEYDTRRFTAETIDRMLRRFEIVLERMIDAPETRVGELPILPREERSKVLVDWNDTKRSYPRDSTIPALFREVVAEHGDRVAVVEGEERITYAELARRAGGLASRVLAHGIEPGEPVGIFMDRCAEAVTAILAILEAGGAYVPLDPAYPKRRLGSMLQDAGARIVLTTPSGRPGRRTGAAPSWWTNAGGADPHATSPSPRPPVRSPATADSLAYVMFTSGSTGRPKGVEVSPPVRHPAGPEYRLRLARRFRDHPPGRQPVLRRGHVRNLGCPPERRSAGLAPGLLLGGRPGADHPVGG